MNHDNTADHLRGNDAGSVDISPFFACSSAIFDVYDCLLPGHFAGMKTDDEMRRLAMNKVAGFIDAEVAEVTAHLATLDTRAIDGERSLATGRACFDPWTHSVLARRFEAAVERGSYRAIQEFCEVEAEDQPRLAEALAILSGSFFPADPGSEGREAEVFEAGPVAVDAGVEEGEAWSVFPVAEAVADEVGGLPGGDDGVGPAEEPGGVEGGGGEGERGGEGDVADQGGDPGLDPQARPGQVRRPRHDDLAGRVDRPVAINPRRKARERAGIPDQDRPRRRLGPDQAPEHARPEVVAVRDE